MSIRYRTAIESDALVIAEMQQRMAFETESMTLDSNVVLRGVRAVFEKTDPAAALGTYHVAETEEGVIVGCTMILPEWSDWRAGTVWWIHSVFVIPEYRGHGVFRGLYKYLKLKVESQSDLRGLRLFVDKTNTNAQSVYRTLGMNGDHYQLWEWMKDS